MHIRKRICFFYDRFKMQIQSNLEMLLNDFDLTPYEKHKGPKACS